MKFLVVNFEFSGDKMLENELDNIIFKDVAFGYKNSNKLGNSLSLSYGHVLIATSTGFQLPIDGFYRVIENSIEKTIELSESEKESIIGFLDISEMLKKNILKYKFSITPVSKINDSEIGVGYSDGSFKKNTNQASFAAYKLLNEDANGCFDDFSGKYYSYKEFSSIIESGTNNIGELSGIKCLIENFDEKKYQVIISDSEYGLKCYREWIYNWRKNNYKTYSKKPIANKDLIVETYEKLKNSNKLVFFMWVKGHASNSFNELCDEKAKKVLEE